MALYCLSVCLFVGLSDLLSVHVFWRARREKVVQNLNTTDMFSLLSMTMREFFWPKRQIASAGAHSLSLSLYLSLSLSIHPASQPAMWVCVCVCYTACPPNTFRCVSNGICIPTCQLCDGYSQCDDNSDEYNCAHNNSKYACVDHFMQLRSMWRLAVCLLSCRNASCPMWYQITDYTVSRKKITPCIHCHNSDKQCQILTEFRQQCKV